MIVDSSLTGTTTSDEFTNSKPQNLLISITGSGTDGAGAAGTYTLQRWSEAREAFVDVLELEAYDRVVFAWSGRHRLKVAGETDTTMLEVDGYQIS